MLNNQYKQYRCYYFSRGSPPAKQAVGALFRSYLWMRIAPESLPYQYFGAVSVCEEHRVNLHSGVIHS